MRPPAHEPTRSRRSTRAALAVVALTLAIVGCSSEHRNRAETSTSTPTDVCHARDEVRGAVEELGKVDVRANGTNALDTAIEDVKTSLDDLEKASKSRYSSEISAIHTSIDELQATVSTLDTSSASSAISALGTSVTNFTKAVSDLATKVSTQC